MPNTMPANDVIIIGTFSADTGIEEMNSDEELVIYNINGILINRSEIVSNKTYIINGKKVYIK